jgi:hypothetical protein
MATDLHPTVQPDVVNAWRDDDDVIVSLRVDGEWRDVRLTRDHADQIQGMLYLLVKHVDVEVASR